jgi:hypothetical protein
MPQSMQARIWTQRTHWIGAVGSLPVIRTINRRALNRGVPATVRASAVCHLPFLGETTLDRRLRAGVRPQTIGDADVINSARTFVRPDDLDEPTLLLAEALGSVPGISIGMESHTPSFPRSARQSSSGPPRTTATSFPTVRPRETPARHGCDAQAARTAWNRSFRTETLTIRRSSTRPSPSPGPGRLPPRWGPHTHIMSRRCDHSSGRRQDRAQSGAIDAHLRR